MWHSGILNAEKSQFKLREVLISFQYFSNQQEGDKKQQTALLSNEMLEDSGWGCYCLNMTLSLKLFLQWFSRRILNSCRVCSPAQGWAVRWLYCSITGSQKTYKTSASLLKMQKSLQGHPFLVQVRGMSGQLRISNEERSKCSCVAVRYRLHVLVCLTCLQVRESFLLEHTEAIPASLSLFSD